MSYSTIAQYELTAIAQYELTGIFTIAHIELVAIAHIELTVNQYLLGLSSVSTDVYHLCR